MTPRQIRHECAAIGLRVEWEIPALIALFCAFLWLFAAVTP